MQVKRPIKMNKYHLKSLQDTYSKNTREGATQKQSTSKQKKKRYKLLVICSKIPHTQILHHVTISQLTGFHKTQDKRTRNLRTDPSNKSQ